MARHLYRLHAFRAPLSALVPALALCTILAPAATARTSAPDTLFVRTHTAEMRRLADAGAASAGSPRGAVDAIRRMLLTRAAALQELATRYPLTQFDGIETQDRYDHEVTLAVSRVARTGVAADSTLPPEEDALWFQTVMGDLPDFGETPVGFMILASVEGAVATADSLQRAQGFSALSADKLALRYVRRATQDYVAMQDDFIRRAKAEGFRQSSVVLRMRCPKDGATYKVVDMKNKLGAEGDVSTIYFLNCMGCGEPESLQFPLEVASRLNRAAERQPLKHKPQARTPTEGLQP